MLRTALPSGQLSQQHLAIGIIKQRTMNAQRRLEVRLCDQQLALFERQQVAVKMNLRRLQRISAQEQRSFPRGDLKSGIRLGVFSLCLIQSAQSQSMRRPVDRLKRDPAIDVLFVEARRGASEQLFGCVE